MQIKDLEKEIKVASYSPSKEEQILRNFVDNRVIELKDYRKSLKIEDEWKEADNEYIPEPLDTNTGRKRFEQNQDTGLRSRLVPVGDSSDDWRSRNSAPTLLSKIQTAISQIIDNDPEGMLTAMAKRYEDTTDLIYSLWKRNWQINDSKEILKLFVFNTVKYGWAVGRSFPKIVKYKKRILTEVDTENPENNKYEEKEIVWFNDVARENLNPYKVWIDEQTKPYNIYSMNDCYYEMDFSYDAAEVEFGQYPNWKSVSKDSRVTDDNDDKKGENKKRSDIVTIGFYENRLKDLYVIYVPKDKIILYNSPLPNDDGLLSLWHTPWVLRSAESPYGISLWKIIKQDKALYDKMNNMTMDQLVLSIMKFGWYTGTSALTGDGVITIKPGQAKQLINGEIKWMEIPGPGQDSWKGLEVSQRRMDDSSGITPTMEGDLTGKTLGEIQIAREAALKRLKVPLENIANAIEQDAYLTISWMSQVYSTPEVKEFASEQEMMAYESENQVDRSELFQNEETGGLTATYFPNMALHLEDREGKLLESRESRYVQIGKDIDPSYLKWRGIFKIIPKSLVGSSQLVMKQAKMELFNILVPLFAQPPELVRKAAVQILKINEEDENDWLPDVPGWMPEIRPQEVEQPVFVPQEEGTEEEGGIATDQRPETVVPPSQVSSMMSQQTQGGGLGSLFRKQ